MEAAGRAALSGSTPNALPLRFATSDAAADGAMREIELHRERLVLRRSVAGIRMTLNVPLSAFSGVALRVSREGLDVLLTHKDPGLRVPLCLSGEPEQAYAEWQEWGRVLALPLLVHDETGVREAFPRLGELRIGRLRPRRRRRSALKRRRPSISFRRATPVHRGEREIITRN
jgi:Family of unknown function (DUF6101)